MFKNYLIVAWRNLTKNKVFSLINILGLTIGITVCLMIFLFIMNEFSVDDFQKNGKNIYRVMRVMDNKGKAANVAWVSGPYAPALQNDFKGQIQQVVRINPTNNLVTIGTRSFNEKKVYDADANFFDVFSFPLIKGNASSVLKNPNSVVLTESTAKKYFGSVDNAIGKVIQLDKKEPLQVTGIAKDVPSNSHLDFDLVIPIDLYKSYDFMTSWMYNGMYVYAMLSPQTKAQDIEKQLPQFTNKYMGADMKKFGYKFSLSFVPLKDIYFQQDSYDRVKHGDRTVVYIFLSIAALILLIACINFMNLSTIRAVERSKEVGLRKVLGAMRNNLVWQFIGESVLLSAVSCLLSVGLLFLVMPWYNDLLGYTLNVSWNTSYIYLFLVGVIVVVGFLAGSYPAFFLSAFSPVQALKGKLRLGKGGSLFRQALVVVQFSISVFLIVGVIIIYNQMSYVKNKQLGYDKGQTMIIPINNDDIYNNRVAFKNDLLNNPSIASVSVMSGEPGGFYDKQMFDVEAHTEKWLATTEFADYNYVKTLGLKLIAGRDFSAQYGTDSSDAIIINRTAASNLGYTPDKAVGKWILNSVRDEHKRHVVGVVEDFNYSTLKEKIDPLVISTGEDARTILLKIKPGSLLSGVAAIKKEYALLAPSYPLEYTFLDQKFEELYKNDLRQQAILSVFAGLAIFVACLGLFGLASFTATRRIKEIGVRKVLGSSVQNIVVLLSKDLLKPVLIATCIAMPLGYYVMHQWLQNFAYQTSLSVWIFLLAAMITFGIAFITVSFKAIKAALMNPVKSLRTE